VTPLELQEIYLKTDVSIEQAGQLVPARDVTLLQSGVVHVLTGWNPGDARPSRAENDAANQRLFDRLVTLGCKPVKAVGADPDSEHFEESWAVAGLSDESARAIGAVYGQVAVFRIANGVQTVLACSEDWSLSRPL